MQSLTVDMPQTLRAKLQEYQNEQDIDQPTEAILAILEAYLQTWSPAKAPATLPAMYDAEDGPCEVLTSFLEPSSAEHPA
ncbi:MAG: hypothetical protein WBD47_13780 [Phormidesmis sp.]